MCGRKVTSEGLSDNKIEINNKVANRYRKQVVPEAEAKPVEEPEVQPDELDEVDTIDEQPLQQPSAEPEAKRGILGRVLGGDLLGDKLVLRQIPLVVLCMVYLLLIVNNRYRIESLSREKIATEERINYLREQRIQMQKQYQQSVKISQIAEDLAGTGVGITAGPPYEIER